MHGELHLHTRIMCRYLLFYFIVYAYVQRTYARMYIQCTQKRELEYIDIEFVHTSRLYLEFNSKQTLKIVNALAHYGKNRHYIRLRFHDVL